MNPDVYVPGTQAGGTGYNAINDKGLQLVLKANNQDKAAPSFYNPWDLPGSTGANDYRNNIANCNTNLIEIGHIMATEPGNMVGPTKDGTLDLKAKDPERVTGTPTATASRAARSARARESRLFRSTTPSTTKKASTTATTPA